MVKNILLFFSRTTFRKEICAVIIIKLCLLTLLWEISFSHRDHLDINKVSIRFEE